MEILQADQRYKSASLFEEDAMGCKETVLPDPLLKKFSIKCLTFEKNTRKPYKENLCLFRSLEVHLHAHERPEEESSKIFNLLIEKTAETDPANLRGVCVEDNAAVEDNVQTKIFLYDIDIVDGSMIGELVRRIVGKHSNTAQLLRYESHICNLSNINAFFKAYRCL